MYEVVAENRDILGRAGSFEDCVAMWEKYRDENGYGARDCPYARIVDIETRVTVARISYNGRLWSPDGKSGIQPPYHN